MVIPVDVQEGEGPTEELAEARNWGPKRWKDSIWLGKRMIVGFKGKIFIDFWVYLKWINMGKKHRI